MKASKIRVRTTTIALVAMLVFAGGLLAQRQFDRKAIGKDMLAALNGDMVSFERGMKAVEDELAQNPKQPELMVMHGSGVVMRAAEVFQKGDLQVAGKMWQSGLDEMDEAARLAPDNLFVRARRGVFMLTASRTAPPIVGQPLMTRAVSDFERVLEIRDKEGTFSKGSAHQRGELLTGIGDGWSRLDNPDKARVYFERAVNEMKGTVYEQKARAWLDQKPETKSPEFFKCSGCHVE